MRVSNINEKTVDFIRTNGKRILCTAALGATLVVPVEEALAEKNQNEENSLLTKQSQNTNYNNVSDEELISQMADEQKISIEIDGKTTVIDAKDMDKAIEQAKEFVSENVKEEKKEDWVSIVTSEWRKSENYSEDNLEYYRYVLKITPNESFDPLVFNRKWENLVKDIYERPQDISHMFTVLENDKETKTFTSKEEKNLNTKFFSLSVEGKDITVYYQITTPEDIRAMYLTAIVIGLSFGLMFAGAILISNK